MNDSIRSHVDQTQFTHQKTNRVKPLNDRALYGILGDIVNSIDDQIEPAKENIFTHLLALSATYIGDKVYTSFDNSSRVTLNDYYLLIGDSSYARKGTGYKMTRNIFNTNDPYFVTDNVRTGLSTGEGLISLMRDPNPDIEEDEGVKDKRFLIVETEFGSVLKVMKREGNTLSTALRNLYDGNPVEILTKTEKMRASNTHLSVIGHITEEEYRSLQKEVDLYNGFSNRFMHVWTKRTNSIALGANATPHPDMITTLFQRLNEAKSKAYVGFSKEGEKVYTEFYNDLEQQNLTPSKLDNIFSRAPLHVLKLALLHAVMNGHNQINGDHILSAVAFYDYVKSSTHYIFENHSGNPQLDKVRTVLVFLKQQGRSEITKTELFNNFKHTPVRQLNYVLGLLVEQDEIKIKTSNTGGRPAQIISLEKLIP